MCIYCQNFDPKFVVRIWDIFFAEGWPIIFQVALALFQSIQGWGCHRALLVDEIMELTADEILVFIQHGSLMFDYKDRWITKLTPDELIKKALKFKVTEKDLEKYHEEYSRKVLKRKNLTNCSVCFTSSNGYSARRRCPMRNCERVFGELQGLHDTRNAALPRRAFSCL